MTTRSTVEIEPIVVDMRRRTKAADRELREAIKKGTGYIDDLPPFLYIEYAMCSTAVGDLMLEYEIAAESAKLSKSVASATSAVSKTPTIVHITAFQDAMKFADEFRSLSQDLNQAQATQDSIEKLAEANDFRKVDWDALEGTWALDHDATLTQLDNEIRAIAPAIGAAKERLEAALARRAWWQKCKLKYSSMICLIDYIPQDIEESDEDEAVIEQEHVTAKLAVKGIILKATDENYDINHKSTHRKLSFETFDSLWLDKDDKEGRELAENFSRDQRKEMIAKWAAKHGLGKEGEEDEESDEE
ncbi:hypothetical protein E8E11_004448 [Didymella keratinophila]|nr:hypothetical protein E8E11_004448 [Didymella keratinophila]